MKALFFLLSLSPLFCETGGKQFNAYQKVEKNLEDEWKEVVSRLPPTQSEQIVRILQYLSISSQTVAQLKEQKLWDQALEVLQKRLRLEVEDSLMKIAPLPIRVFRASTRSDIGLVYIQMNQPAKGIPYLEEAYREMSQNRHQVSAIRIQRDLVRAYKKAGQTKKAQELMQSMLQESEKGLAFRPESNLATPSSTHGSSTSNSQMPYKSVQTSAILVTRPISHLSSPGLVLTSRSVKFDTGSSAPRPHTSKP